MRDQEYNQQNYRSQNCPEFPGMVKLLHDECNNPENESDNGFVVC
jgi:hypothetical protein